MIKNYISSIAPSFVTLLAVSPFSMLSAQELQTETSKTKTQKPNIIYFLADDAGVFDLGCYGQKIIKTPNIDKLAEEGIRFTQHYAGAPVCAPARCTLLTGKHTGNSAIRDNRELLPEGQQPLPKEEVTIAEMLKNKGYQTGIVGKWGLGQNNSEGSPLNQGFDYFYGYICQRAAHSYYPNFLWENNKKVEIENPHIAHHQAFTNGDPTNPKQYNRYKGKNFAGDLVAKKALDFIEKNSEKPFFLYWATTTPHAALQVPDDSLDQYEFIEEEGPYMGFRGYTPHIRPRAAYAGMMSRMDKNIGKMMHLLKKLGIEDKTLVIFASDNGPSGEGGKDNAYFKSTNNLRGFKRDLYEGGIRVPMIAHWKNKIKANSVTNQISSFWDILPTLAEITNSEVPEGVDGISILPTLLGKEQTKQPPYLYWEFGCKKKAIRMGDWKAIQNHPFGSIELYNLKNDPSEKNNIARKNPKIVEKMRLKLKEVRTPSKIFRMAGDTIWYDKKGKLKK